MSDITRVKYALLKPVSIGSLYSKMFPNLNLKSRYINRLIKSLLKSQSSVERLEYNTVQLVIDKMHLFTGGTGIYSILFTSANMSTINLNLHIHHPSGSEHQTPNPLTCSCYAVFSCLALKMSQAP